MSDAAHRVYVRILDESKLGRWSRPRSPTERLVMQELDSRGHVQRARSGGYGVPALFPAVSRGGEWIAYAVDGDRTTYCRADGRGGAVWTETP